jgi:hypothetical protein
MLSLTKGRPASDETRSDSTLTKRTVNSYFFKREICNSELSGPGNYLRGSLPKECLTSFHEVGIIRFSNFREPSPVATKIPRTRISRLLTHCFLQACTTAIWSSPADRSTQSWPIQALVCSDRKVLRLMPTASLDGDKEGPTGCIRTPACFCARNGHRNHATLAQRRIWTSPGMWTGMRPCVSSRHTMKWGPTFVKPSLQEKTQPIFR